MISIRLSEEEFIDLKNQCAANGARSVSDLARTAMCGLLKGTDKDSILRTRVEECRSEIKALNRKIEELSTRLGSRLS